MSHVGGVRRYITRERVWRAWHGTVDDLRAVHHTVESLHQRLPTSSLPESDWEHTRLEVTLRHGGDSASGRFEDVIAELDRRTISSISIKITSRYQSGSPLALVFTFDGFTPAVTLAVRDVDRGWVNQASGSLSEEVDKGVPRWAPVHRESLRLLLTVIAVMAIATATGPFYRLFMPEPWWYVANNLTGLAIATPFLISYNRWYWLFPKVEILVPGAGSTGSRRFAAAAGLILTIILGVYVNAIS